MTNERAIEILDPEHREHYDGLDEVNEACRLGMDALRERIERRNGGWISVKDRLPKDGEAVMIFIKKKQGMREVIPGVFHRETCWNGETREWWNACGRSCPSDSIICWKAFPAPPEQEEPHD
jgi:hypothetical protein